MNFILFKAYILLSFFPLLVVIGQEKKTVISFDYYTHDYGTIKETDGPVSYEFMFKNVGNATLLIKNVVASCGCTVAHWTKEPIAQGNSGKISVEFNPLNKPGTFSKTLTVFSNSIQDGIILTLIGKVIPKPRKVHDDYPDKIGNLRMVSRYMNLGEITTEKWQRKYFDIFNHSDSAITIKKILFNNTYLNVKVDPMTIEPLQKARITVELSPKWRNDFGFVQDRIELRTDEAVDSVKSIFSTAYITQYFPVLPPEESVKNPKIKFESNFHNFGIAIPGQKLVHTFTIKNEGQNELQILKIKSSCGCTVADIDKKTIKSGQTATLTAIFDTAGKDGIQEKSINVYTNDPKNHNVVFSLKVKLKKA